MGKVHISLVGTSSLGHFYRTEQELMNGLGINQDLSRIPLDSPLQETVRRNHDFLLGKLVDFLNGDPERRSAELNGLFKAQKEVGCDRVVLVATNTPTGTLAGEAVKRVLEGRGIPVETKTIRSIGQGEFERGMEELTNEVAVSISESLAAGDRVYLHASPGLKPEGAYLTLLGMLYDVDVYYLHESFDHLVFLPRVPVTLREDVARPLKDLLEGKEVSEEVLKALRERRIVSPKTGTASGYEVPHVLTKVLREYTVVNPETLESLGVYDDENRALEEAKKFAASLKRRIMVYYGTGALVVDPPL